MNCAGTAELNEQKGQTQKQTKSEKTESQVLRNTKVDHHFPCPCSFFPFPLTSLFLLRGFSLEILRRSGLFDVSYIVRKRRLRLFGHVARLRSAAPTNQILQICTKTRDGDRPSQEWRRASGRLPTTWIHQICRDPGVTATEALELAEDEPFWRTIATAGRFG